jgi:heme/copper-type cytochrome/quinol oxidase subunit 2
MIQAQPHTYIFLFMIAGIFWIILALTFAVVWYLFMRAINPKPKTTRWEKDWEENVRSLNGVDEYD